ncbi:transcriptional regulator, IclR family [Rubrobacter xylanophilus DSM 9941]|uniref:Glycerol operon regulatory protein n=1 Tax=Rubrobacter xylanophilus (strain DSM 9941 / JCM 11954 / NBRC 16129 / PRD-1) TaxID=266117 RepID=Q1AYT9_RUBXD|nr:IclR family transcriptional regulator [Rubrobacter xylanophilus]ABG03439.1 transcriptional regulator, IclR family [Rubrobacter xylanophilus DSM 9941]
METARTDDRNRNRPGTRSGTSALRHGIRVLQTFTREEPILGVSEIARRVGLHKSTVSRILATLEEAMLVERHPTSGRFRLGVGVIALAGPMLANLDVRRVARPFLEELTRATGETTGLLVWSEGAAISVEQVASPKTVKHTIPIGTQFREHASASVKVFLAESPPEEVQKVLDRGLKRYSERTVVDPEEYLKGLQRVRELGYAVNAGETSLEETGIAAPVRDHRDQTVAAVLLSAPYYRTPPERIEELGELVRKTAEAISKRLGGASA